MDAVVVGRFWEFGEGVDVGEEETGRGHWTEEEGTGRGGGRGGSKEAMGWDEAGG